MVALDRWISPPFGNIPASGGTLHFAVSPDERHRVTGYHPPLSAYWIRDVSFNRNTGILSVAVYPNPNPDPNSERSTNISVWFGMHLRSVRVVQPGGRPAQINLTFVYGALGDTIVIPVSSGIPIGDLPELNVLNHVRHENGPIMHPPPHIGQHGRFSGTVGWFVGNYRVTQYSIFHQNTTITIRWTDPNRHLHYWWQYTDVPLNVRGVANHAWLPHIRAGMDNWTYNVGNYIRVIEDAGADNDIFVRDERRDIPIEHIDLLAVVLPLDVSNTSMSRFNIIFQRYLIENHFDNSHDLHNFGYFIESIMAHEIGHVVGLQDGEIPRNSISIGGSSPASLMNRYAILVYGVKEPTEFDNRSVHWIHDRRRER